MEVGVTMYVLSISSVSEVLMVHTQKIYQLKTFYKPKKKWKLLFFCLKKNQKLNQKKVYHQLLVNFLIYLYLSVSLSSQLSTSTYYSLSLLLLLPLSLSVSLCSCFTHNLCNICSYIISLFKSKKKHIHCVEISFHFIVDFLHSFWNKANCKITNAYTPIIQYILIYKHILKFLPIKCCVNNCFAMPCQFVIAPK